MSYKWNRTCVTKKCVNSWQYLPFERCCHFPCGFSTQRKAATTSFLLMRSSFRVSHHLRISESPKSMRRPPEKIRRENLACNLADVSAGASPIIIWYMGHYFLDFRNGNIHLWVCYMPTIILFYCQQDQGMPSSADADANIY